MTRGKVSQSEETVSTSIPRVTKTQKATICTAYCTCKCQSFQKIGPPRILSNVFGHGYVMITGSFFGKTQCDSLLCKAQAAPRIAVQYHLPQWLAARMILMWLTSCPPCSPELSLRVPRVLEDENAAFADVESFRLAVTKGDCTPYDVNQFGITIFTVRTAMKTLTLKRLIDDKHCSVAHFMSCLGQIDSSLELSRILEFLIRHGPGRANSLEIANS